MNKASRRTCIPLDTKLDLLEAYLGVDENDLPTFEHDGIVTKNPEQ